MPARCVGVRPRGRGARQLRIADHAPLRRDDRRRIRPRLDLRKNVSTRFKACRPTAHSAGTPCRRVSAVRRREIALMHQRVDHLGEAALLRSLVEGIRQHRPAAFHARGIGLEDHRLSASGPSDEIGHGEQECLQLASFILGQQHQLGIDRLQHRPIACQEILQRNRLVEMFDANASSDSA